MTLTIHSNVKEQVPPFYPLDEKQADKIFALYRRFWDETPYPNFLWMKQQFLSVEKCPYHWRDLSIGISCDTMEKVLSETGILQLRDVLKDCRFLVVGCGNYPLADAGGYSLAPKHIKEDESERYRCLHEHRDAITINPHLASNPTLVGYFGSQRFPMLSDGQFDLIAIEATSIGDTPEGREELSRLLSPKGTVVQLLGDEKGYQFTWELNSIDVWSLGIDENPFPLVIEDMRVYPPFQPSLDFSSEGV